MRQTLAADALKTSPICAGCSRKKVLSKALASTGSFAYGAPSFSGALRPAPDKALVAQLDRAPDYESGGREFESSRARHSLSNLGNHKRFTGIVGYRWGTILRAVSKMLLEMLA